MDTYRELVITTTTNWIGSTVFKVIERDVEISKPHNVRLENEIFSGSILECQAYLTMYDSGRIKR